MKKFIFFARVYAWWILAFPISLSAQDTTTAYPNYVVIGAFAFHQNAIEFTDEANKNNFPAKFEMNPNRNLYYVYVLTTDDRALAFAEAKKLRRDTKYFDTWVYSGPFGESGFAQRGTGQNQDFNPETGGQLHTINTVEEQGAQIDGTASPLLHGAEKTLAINNTEGSHASLNVIETEETTARTSRKKKKNKEIQQGGRETNAGVGHSDQTALNQGQTSQQGVITDHSNSLPQDATQVTTGQNNKQGTSMQHPAADLTNAPSQNQRAESTPIQTSGPQGQTAANKDQSPSTAGQNKNGKAAGDVANTFIQDKTTNNAGLITKETDKALTDAGRKALAENREKQIALGPPPQRATTAPLTKEEIQGKDFYFHLFRGDNLDMVNGDVDAIDFEKSRRMATYQGNTAVKVMMPAGKTKQISFVCQVFGYRKQQREFDALSPPEDVYLDDKGNLVVSFELVRMQKGDIAIMYNVFFFKDAAVMRPESRYEVNNLLDLLAENPTYKIMIHGHTNGNAAGKIIRMDTPSNFYSLSGTKQGFGSAKELSEERAIVIRNFLVNSGISPDRMQVKAWGGKKPIHDKHSVRANENVRVEIEILSE